MTSPAATLRDLARARAAFQQRTVVAYMTHPPTQPKEAPMTDPVPNSRRSPMEHEHSLPDARAMPMAADFDGCQKVWFGVNNLGKAWWRLDVIMNGAATASSAILPDAHAAALDAAHARIAALEAVLVLVRSDAAHHLKRYRPHCLAAINEAITDPPASDTQG